MTKKIVGKDSPVLREIAKEVAIEDIGGSKIKTVINEMKKALAGEDDGVAIAAPQIGYPLRIFVISHKVEDIVRESKGLEEKSKNKEDLVFINPVITKVSKEKKYVEEGCLSVRYLYGKVNRSVKATVVSYDEKGKKKTTGGKGLLAQIFQHEIDHLDGILFIDKAKDLEDIPPQSVKK